MGNKRGNKRKNQHRNRKRTPPVSIEVCTAQAWQALENNHYRDAITHFKTLLKAKDSEELKTGLADAYQGRARELVAKGMLKEAVMIWGNRANFCPDAAPDPEYFNALVRTGHALEAAQYFSRVEKTLDRQTLSGLRSQLAALYLSGGTGFEQVLASDDPVIVHAAFARTALASWTKGDDTASAEALANIPFRSPYRDWVQLLKALMKLPVDVVGAGALLQRIPPDSAFAPLVRAAEIALLPDSSFDARLQQAGEMTRRFAAALRGWTQARLALWLELNRPVGNSAPADRLGKVIGRHSHLLDTAWAQHYGLRLFMQQAPQRRKRSSWLSEDDLTPFQQQLVAAWQTEATNDPWEIYASWQRVIQTLRQPSDPLPGSTGALRIALIQRRLETQWHLLGYPDNPWDGDSLAQRVLAQLEESLHFDPDDKPTYIRVISHHREAKALKQARRVLEQALARWPDNVAVLTEAMETAVTGNAYKKAATYAHRVLALDPINSKVIDKLFEMHLSHARKLLGKGRNDLTERELLAASEWARGDKAAVKLNILHGLILFNTDEQAGKTALQAAIDHLGGLTGQLVLLLELALLGRAPKDTAKQLKLAKIATPEKADFLQCLRELRRSLDGKGPLPQAIATYFEPALKRAASLDLTLQESEIACETLHRIDLDKARLAHARAALKRWPGQPALELHAFEASHTDAYAPITEAQITRLDDAAERARAAGDTRTANRIASTLHQHLAPPPGMSLPDEPPEEFRELVEDIGIEAVMEAFEAMLGGDLPDELSGKKTRKKRRRKPGEDDPNQLGMFE